MYKAKLVASLAAILVTGAHADVSSQKFINLYNTSTDYKTLVESGFSDPESGGYFYAHRVLSECATVRQIADIDNSKKNKAAKSTQQKYSINLLNSRCKNFSDSDLSHEQINKIWLDGLEKNDPLIKAAKRYENPGISSRRGGSETQAKRIEAISAITEVKDPLLVQDLGLRLVVSTNNSNRAVFRAHGEESSLKTKVDLGMAASLVPCEMGLKCDKSEFSVLIPCATQGLCDESRYDAVERMTKKAGNDYSAVLSKAKSISQSILIDSPSSRKLE